MKLTELDPHFVVRCDEPLAFEHSHRIDRAQGIQLKCPACFWTANRRGRPSDIHSVIVWQPEPSEWSFIGHDFRDLSVMAGRISVMLTAGGCRSRFTIKQGKVDFI